jgi:hypothetical protein
MQVNDSPLIWGVQARCGFATSFRVSLGGLSHAPGDYAARCSSARRRRVRSALLGAALVANRRAVVQRLAEAAWCAAVPAIARRAGCCSGDRK